MKKINYLITLLAWAISCTPSIYPNSNDQNYKIYRSLEKAIKNKEKAYVLILNNKNLSEFPPEILKLKKLKILSLYNNNIESIPEGIDQLEDLEILDIWKNELDNLPASISKLKKLKRINVLYNDIDEKDLKVIRDSLPNCKFYVYPEI
jgi:Leucine-rich repeat (LRR) protein